MTDQPDDLEALYNQKIAKTTAGRDIVWGKDLDDLEKPTPLIEGVLDLRSIAVLYGEWGTYKSFVVHDMAMAVALGLPWHGHATQQGTVLFWVGEGFYWTKGRQNAWLGGHKISADPPVGYLNGVPNLLDPVGVKEFLEITSALKPTFTIIDTLARALPGGEENSSTVMGRAINVMGQAVDITGGTVLGAHHAGKDITKGARGHSSLPAGVDTIIECSKRQGNARLYVEKQKNHPDNEELLMLRPHAWGDSLYLEPTAPVSGSKLVVDRIREYLIANPGAGHKELRAGISGKDQTKVDAIRDCVQNKTIRTEVDGNLLKHFWQGA